MNYRIVSMLIIQFFILLSFNNQVAISNDEHGLLSYHHVQSPSDVNNTLKNYQHGNRYISIDFKDVEIEILIKFISDLTGTNFILDPRIKNKRITIMSPKKISVTGAYQLFKSVLEIQGLALVQSGKATKIIPASEAAQNSVETRLYEKTGQSNENFISQLIQLNYADANEIKKLFATLISKNSKIVSYPQTNTILITDTQSNINRLLQILSVIDRENVDQELSIVKINHTSSDKIVKTLNSVFDKSKSYSSQRDHVKVISDEHTNAIIILARPYQIKKIKHLIAILDQQSQKSNGKIHVRYLEHANAEEMVSVLNNLSQKSKQNENKSKQSILSKNMVIVADKATNSLIITAEKEDYAVLNDVIQKIDIPRPMVYIECMIMEVSGDKNVEFGPVIKVGDIENKLTNQYTSPYLASFAPEYSNLSKITTPFLGVMGQSITIGNQFFPSITALYSAITTNSDFNIISKPQILTLNNVEAEIIVGDKIPYLTKTSPEYGSSYEYNEVGVKLKVKPQINHKRFVRLEISQIVETIVGVSDHLPQTSKRSTKTTIVVKDNETAIISGLIKNKTDKTQKRIPCLGNIPLLKLLFRTIANTSKKTNMFLFLTPHILENEDEASVYYDKKRGSLSHKHSWLDHRQK